MIRVSHFVYLGTAFAIVLDFVVSDGAYVYISVALHVNRHWCSQ